MDTDELALDMKQLQNTGIIDSVPNGWFVCKFAERQAAIPGKERVKQSRDNQKKEQYYSNEDVTNRYSGVTQSRLTEEINRGESDTESERESQSTPFDNMRVFVETVTGIPVMPQSIKAINELVEIGATREDIAEGYRWVQENSGKPLRYHGQLVGPARTAMSKRLGKSYKKQPARRDTEDAIKKYGEMP